MSTFYADGYNDRKAGCNFSAPSIPVYAEEYAEGWRDAGEDLIAPALKARLKRYKDNAASMAARLGLPIVESLAAKDWRNCRYPKPAILSGKNQITRDSKNPRIIYAGSFDRLPLSFVGDACEFGRNIPRGWYTSEDCDTGTLKGAVLSFRDPHRQTNDENENSHVFYLSATYHSDWDGVTVYADSIHTTRRGAALYADECTRVEAEQCREDDARYQLERRAEEAREELHGLNVSTLALIREIKAARQSLTPAICSALTAALKSALRQRAALFQTIQAGV